MHLDNTAAAEAALPNTFTPEMLIAATVLVIAYALIFSEVMHRTSAATIGAVAMVAVGSVFGFYSQEAAVMAIDANTMFLLAGMMMIVALLRPTGGFEYIAIAIAKRAYRSPKLLFVLLGFTVSVISMVLDNVTTMIIFAPLTVLITRLLALNPMPYLMGEAMLSNVGGAATLVGDPPNIMIGSAGGIDFTSFLVHMGPLVAPIWLLTTVTILLLFYRQFKTSKAGVIDLDERKAIKEPQTLWRILFALLVVIVLFFIHHLLGIYPAYATLVGLAVAMALIRPDPEALLGEVHWSVLLFFAALFVIVGGVEGSGLLDYLGAQLLHVAQDPDKLLLTCILLMWVAAIVSAVVDNIPFTVTMIPIILGLQSQAVEVAPLWWALAIGVALGGNGSHIGATANVIAVSESEKAGIKDARITPAGWLRIGIPTMLISLTAASLIFALGFGYFRA